MRQGSEYERSRSKAIIFSYKNIDLITGRKLAAEAEKLEKMKFEPVWSKIVENQKNKAEIQQIFRRIDAYTVDFQVHDLSFQGMNNLAHLALPV